jgi:Mg2+ and Co2+ transporter CorA
MNRLLQVAPESREAVFGTFDVLVGRSERRTNEITKLLTLGTLLFLPDAGVMGMNVRVGFFEHRRSSGWCAPTSSPSPRVRSSSRMRRWI